MLGVSDEAGVFGGDELALLVVEGEPFPVGIGLFVCVELEFEGSTIGEVVLVDTLIIGVEEFDGGTIGEVVLVDILIIGVEEFDGGTNGELEFATIELLIDTEGVTLNEDDAGGKIGVDDIGGVGILVNDIAI